MNSKIIGGILLIIGTSIGAGMLALPTAAAAGGYFHGLVLMLASWLVMTFGALFILEANLWLPEHSNLVSMARATIGRSGQVLTWIAYLLLLYSLLCAYIAGGSDLLRYLLSLIHITTPNALSIILFALILGSVVYKGVAVVDFTNRGLMSVKVIAYLALIVLVTPHVELEKLQGGSFKLLASALMVMITSFGYATIIPTLRSYFGSDVKSLRMVVWCGSLISLICYLLWNFVVQGSLEASGPHGLVQMAQSGEAASQLTQALSVRLSSISIEYLTRIFSSICVTTSFLGVALCLTDFLADGLNIKKIGWGKLKIALLTLLPPTVIVLFDPSVFIMGLTYAGICCVVLLVFLPALMVWCGRYVRRFPSDQYQVGGGAFVVGIVLLIGIYLVIHGFVFLH